MKNLSAIIPVNDTIVESILTENAELFTELGIKAERVDASNHLFESGLSLIHFIVPEDKVSVVADIDMGLSVMMDELRQAAKKYLNENDN